MKNYISKQFAIALLLALAPLSISTAMGGLMMIITIIPLHHRP